MTTPRRSWLITVSGPDREGITAEVTRALSEHQCLILDIGQAVLHGWLSLSVLFALSRTESDESAVLKDLMFLASKLGLRLEYREHSEADAPAHHEDTVTEYAITLLGSEIRAKALSHVAKEVALHGLNIDRIDRLNDGQVRCVELLCSTTKPLDEHSLRRGLLTIASEESVDVALQQEGILRRAKRLIAFDMDSTLIENEVIDLCAAELGCFEQVSRITEDAMQGRLDYSESLTARVKLLEGMTESQREIVYQKIQLSPGAEELIRVLKRMGYQIALISGGFSVFADRLKARLGIDYAYANRLEIDVEGNLTGKVIPPIVDAQRKADLLDLIAQQGNLSRDQIIAVGDGANDLLMLERAGLSIAFQAKAVLREKSRAALSHERDLRHVLFLLGISARDQRNVNRSLMS